MTQELRKLAEAASMHGHHIYTHPRDDVNWQANEAWIDAANPAAILELLDRLEKAEKDAGRYRWLRDRHDTSDTFWHVRGSSGNPVLSGRLDKTIDTAMEASK